MTKYPMKDWRFCPKCGYGPQKFVEEQPGAVIYRCLNCGMLIPEPVENLIAKSGLEEK